MKISEFAKSLEEYFKSFFDNEVITRIDYLGAGKFSVEGYLKSTEDWIIDRDKVSLYEIEVSFINEFSPEPVVDFIEIFFLGVTCGVHSTLEDAIVYIKEKLATIKSKTIYENL